MIKATVAEHIDASVERVFALYANPGNWPHVFPTIRATRIMTVATGAGLYKGAVLSPAAPVNRDLRVISG